MTVQISLMKRTVFHTVDLESDADYIEVWSGSPTIETSTQKVLLTGSLRDRTVYGDNNFLIIRLISDNSVERTGFTATWQTDTELSSEERMVEATDSWTEVTSPHYSNSQRPSVYFRQFTVNTTDGSHITMEILDNQLMADGFVYSPQELSSIVLSSSASPLVFVSLGSSFTFHISSTGNSTRAFRARVKRGCSPDLTLTSGVIESPGPTPTGPYPSSLTCTYTVRAPSDHPRGFMISFVSLKLADNKDAVTMYNVTGSVSNQIYTNTRYTMSSQLPQHLYSGSVFVVEFTSSLAQSDGYFALNFSRDCPAVADTSNMNLSTTLSHAFTFVNITCNKGYSFAQEEFFNNSWVTMTCSQDGNWNKPRIPTCQQTYCGVPQSIPNGEITAGSGNARYGATVVYNCFPGFIMNGSSNSTCKENGQWTNPPECQTATCPSPSPIANGNLTLINGDSNSSAERQYFGIIVKYNCNPGYDLIGSRYSLCYSGTWSMQPPVCQAINCPVPEVDRATLSTQSPVELGKSLNITCNPGYTNNGADRFQSTCTSSSMFDVPRNVCQDIDECANNTSGCDVTNGYCNNTSGGFTCVCNSGYTLYTQNGTTGKYIPLSEDGLRQGDVYYINHTCVPVTCAGLPNISHGTLLSASTSYVYNEAAEYRCDRGYTLTGSAVVRCQSNGTWSAPPPVCNPKYCAPLSPTGIVSAVIPEAKTVIGDKVTLVCKSQVGSEYNKTLYCAYDATTDNTTLQGDSPNCPAIDCGSPSLVAVDGSVNVSNVFSGLGDSFEFSCEPGFTVNGVSTSDNRTVRCGEDGRWGFGTLYCEGKRCTDPGTPGGMNMTSASFEVNGMVNYTCLRRGYVASPQARTCVYDNGQTRWDGSTPICVDTEPPVFSYCPSGVIYRNIYTSAAFAMPSAVDNSGLVLPLMVSPPGFRLDMPLAASFNVTFTASDVTGNNATCQVVIIVRDLSVFPDLTCPDNLQFSVSNSTPYTVDLQTAGNITGVNLTFSPNRMVQVGPTTVGVAPYYVTTTYMYGFQRQCAFMVDIRPTACLSDYLTPGGATKQCTSQAGGSLTCTVTCGADMAFQDGNTAKTYSCSGQNVWSPTPARSCTPTVVPRYIYMIAINYTWDGTGDFSYCLNQSGAKLVAEISSKTVTPCTIDGGPPYITFNASVFSLDKNATNLVLELTVASLTSVSSGDFEYCRSIFSNPDSAKAKDFFKISNTTCTGHTGVVTFTPQSRIVTSNGYVCQRGSTLQLVNTKNFCVQCEPGYKDDGGQCTECPSGQYQNEAGQTQCKTCAGNFSSSPRVSASQCVESCPLGFANGQGVVANPSTCYACPVDTYLNTSYTANCTACPSGSTTYGTEGASSSAQCKACPPGQYPVNSTTCSPCPSGYYKTSTGYTKCTECPANTTTNSTGSSDSTSCISPTSSACENGGTPIIYFHEYTCTCPEGYYGKTCENRTDPCASSPCYNGGSCKTLDVKNYTCSCVSGFNGSQCEVDAKNDCQNSTCSDISFCRDKIDSADCVCPSGGNYTGPQCAVTQELCSPSPCKNGATCQKFAAVRSTCQCLPGYTGTTCETLIDQCALNSHGCLYGGQCNNGINNYTCSCNQSYQGSHCQQPPDYCTLSNPCPSGVCYNDYNLSMALCACSYPYRLNVSSGRCEEIDVCSETRPCQNNATCRRVSPGQVHCACPQGYEGSRCQHIVRSCTNSSCAHGQCLDVLNNYTCVCDLGYTGSSCEVNVDDCPGQCDKNNTLNCTDGVNQYTCSCKAGFTGAHCETNVNECASLPCKHNGTCVESATPGDYNCTCRDGWTGKDCDMLPDFCSDTFCQNGGTCYNLQERYFCSCPAGTHGNVCNQTTDVCNIVNPCVSSNQCQSGNGTASCNCPQNYTGVSCQLVKDFCSTNPCQTGQCVTTDVGYSCQCQGTDNCTVTDRSCASATCPSGSSCVETASGPLCLCPPGYLLGGGVCKNTSSDFDIYFTRGSNTMVRALQPFTVTGQALSLTFWISFLGNSRSFPVQLVSDRMDQVLLVSQYGVSFGGTFAVNFTDYNGNPQSLSAEHKWTFCAITWNMTGQYRIHINSVELPSHSGIPNRTFPSIGSLLFPYIGEDFVGYISQLNVWNRTLTSLEALALYDKPFAVPSSLAPVYRWAEYQFNSWVKVISPSTVKRDRDMCQMAKYDDLCPNVTDKTPPVANCSMRDQPIATYRQIQLFDYLSTKTIFPGNDPVSTNMNGTLLTFGAYRVVFASTDTAGNVATCRFNVYVQREGQICSRDEADYGDSNLTSCGAQRSLGETVTCPVNSSVTPFTPKVLTCGKLGSYNLEDQYSLPAAQPCSNITDIQVIATLTLKYQLSVSCGNSEATSIKTSLQNKVKNMTATWQKLCNNSNCDSVTISVVCNSNTTTASLIFHDLQAQLTAANVTYTVTELLKVSAIEEDTFSISFVANARLMKDQVTVSLQTTCRQGYGRFGAGCVQCVSGSFLNSTTNTCELCALGTYTNSPGQTHCTQCPQNQTTLRLGSISCVEECAEGRYYNLSNNACQPCFKSFYQPNKGRVACFPCPPNTFTEGPGTVSVDKCHTACSPGSDMQGTSCVPCARGSYRTGVVKDDKCQNCSVGNTTANSNSTSSTDCYQTACYPGYKRDASTNQCVLCDYGYYQPEQWQEECIRCNISYTTNNTGSTSFSYTTNNTGSTSFSDCIFVCPAGSQDSGNHVCQSCPRGYYRANSLQDRFLGCIACNSSFTTVTTGSTSSSDCNITVCGPGHQYNSTGSKCVACPQGTWNSGNASQQFDSCFPCPATYVTVGEGATSPDNCTLTYCDKGFRPSNASGTCDPCEVGFYKHQRGNSFCIKCPANSTTVDVASTSIYDCNIAFCEPGLYSLTNLLPCLSCPLGTYKNETGDQNCTLCPANLTTPYTGSVTANSCSLVVCPAGKYRNSANICQDCDTGYYQSQPGQTTCHPCDANYTTAAKASTSPENCMINCPPGQYRDTRTSCQKCVMGSYQPNYGAAACINCTTNFITAGSGSTNASDCFISCRPGSYRPPNSKTECLKCPFDKYQDVSNATACINCSKDDFTQHQGSTLQTDCLPKCSLGEYLNISARTCYPCPVGTYNQIGINITACTPCPENKITIGTGAQSIGACNITDCVWGQYRVYGGCMDCPRGTYQPQKSQDRCEPCPPGDTTLLTGQIYISSCIDNCLDGTAYSIAANECEQCIIGYYRKMTETVGCVKCSPGKTTLRQGESSCVDIVAGPTTTPSPVIKRYVVIVAIRMQIEDCSNTVQMTAVIIRYILNRLQSTDAMFPALCAADCQPDLTIRFRNGCLSSSQRKKRSTDQDVLIELKNVPDEISGTGFSGNNVTEKSLGVVVRAFYDTKLDASLLADNKLTFVEVINATATQQCNPGQRLENTTCVDCSAGFFSPDGASNVCKPCEMNTYQEASGQTSCKPCSAKAYTITTASTSSSDCTKLCDRPNARQTYCSDHGTCVFDETTDNGVMCKCEDNWSGNDCNTRQVYCDKGFRLNSTGKSCDPCEVGFYKDQRGNSFCIKCPADSTTANVASTSIDECIPDCTEGQYWVPEGCKDCPMGAYQPKKSQIRCIQCPYGTTTLLTGQVYNSSCVNDCPDGTAYSMFAKVCEKCVIGYYRKKNETMSCIKCAPGKTTVIQGASRCIDLVEGTSSTASPVIKQFFMRVTIRMQIGDCSNTLQTAAAIRRYILNRLLSADAMFPALCATDCQTDLSIHFIGGCLFTSRRKKRSTDQDVLIQLGNASEEILGTDSSGMRVTERSLAVVIRAFYDTKQDASLLADNLLKFVDIINTTITEQCNPGQHIEGTSCVDCSPGYYSTNGTSSMCTPCEMNTYQDAPGQASCKPCSPNTFTSTMASTSSSDCTTNTTPASTATPAPNCEMPRLNLQESCGNNSRTWGYCYKENTACIYPKTRWDSGDRTCQCVHGTVMVADDASNFSCVDIPYPLFRENISHQVGSDAERNTAVYNGSLNLSDLEMNLVQVTYSLSSSYPSDNFISVINNGLNFSVITNRPLPQANAVYLFVLRVEVDSDDLGLHLTDVTILNITVIHTFLKAPEVGVFLLDGSRKGTLVHDVTSALGSLDNTELKLQTDTAIALFELQSNRRIVCVNDVNINNIRISSDAIGHVVTLSLTSSGQVVLVVKVAVIVANTRVTIAENNLPNKNVVTFSSLRESFDIAEQHQRVDLPLILTPNNTAIQLTRGLDFEKDPKSFQFNVSLQFRSNAMLSTSVYITVDVTDINDSPPRFLQNIYIIIAPYCSDNGTLLGQLTAEDQDSLTQTFSYQILPSRNSSLFRIRDSAGILEATKKLPEDAGPDGIVINVTVSDGVNTSPSPTMVIVYVSRYTQEFELVGGNHSLSIVENIPVGTEIFNASLTNYTGYQLLPASVLYFFTINQTTGIIRTRSEIDREGRVPPENLNVVAFQENEVCKLKTVSNVTLTILDENDNPPVFDTSVNYAVSIPENSANGAFVFKFSAADKDYKENATLTYTITSGNSPFRIDSDTGNVTVADSSRLDREVSDTLRLVVTSVDGGTTLPQQLRKSASINLTVTLQDVNDNDPIFNQGVYTVSVYENISVNTNVIVVQAADRDLFLNGQIRYSLGDGGVGVFSISSTTGQLRTRAALDREQYDSFSFFVIASDLGSPPRSSSASVVVKVLDVNDNIPQFQKAVYQPSPIDEGISCWNKSFVKVTAEDKDFGLNSEIVYSIESDLLVINPSTGEVTCKAGGLDYENDTQRTFEVVVRASDKGTPPLNSTSVIRVTVRDVNDNPPVFTNTPYNLSVRVETFDILNSPIFVLSVQDKDSGDNREVDLRLTNPSTGGEGLFTVENSVLRVNRAGRPTLKTFSYTVIATDRGRPPLTSTTFIEIHVSGSGTSLVTFTQKDFSFQMVEEESYFESSGTAIGQLHVTTQIQSSAVFSLVKSSSFSVNSSTGHLFSNKVWDRELDKDSAELTIMAKASVGGDVDYALVKINLLDINDNPPLILTNPKALVGTVVEDARMGTFIISLEATDPDEGPNGTIIFSMEGGLPFRIETENTTGKILVSGSLDREQKEEYVFTVWVRDNVTVPRSNFTTVTILIEDVNDNAPTFVNMAPISVPENTSRGDEVGIVKAIDLDQGKHGSVTYSIDNRTACPFKILADGILLLREALDYETVKSYTCIIEASDEGDIRLSSTATFTILVTDINDNKPVIHSTVSSVTVSRDVSVDYVLVESLNVTDADSVSKGAIFFSFVDPANPTAPLNTNTGTYSYFNINPATGAVSMKNSIQDLPQDDATLSIVAIDAPANQARLMSDVIQIQVNISDNSTRPQFNPIDNINITEGPLTIPRDLTRVSAFVFENKVKVDPCNCSYSIVDIVSELGNGSSLKGIFGINAVSGEISLHAFLDREATGNIIHVTLLATDFGSPRKTGTGTLTVNVVDINDNIPKFSNDSFQLTLTESSCSAGQVVYNITAHDADAPPNNMIRYSLRQLSPDTQLVKVDNSSGELSLVASLCEDEPLITAIATATDMLDPDKQSFVSLKISVKVKDPNPNAPEFLMDLYQSDLSLDGTVDTTFTITDFEAKDKDESQTITYSIESGNCLDLFALDSQTRVFKLKYPNCTTIMPPMVNLSVKATDSGDFPLNFRKSGNTMVQIKIVEKNKQCYTPVDTSALSRATDKFNLFMGLFIAVVILLVIAIIISVIFIYKWRTAVSRSSSITAPESAPQKHSDMGPSLTKISKKKMSVDIPGFPPQLPKRSNAGIHSGPEDSEDSGITGLWLSPDQSLDSAGYLAPSVRQYSWEDEGHGSLGAEDHPGRAGYLSVIPESTHHQSHNPETGDLASPRYVHVRLDSSPPPCEPQHGTYLKATVEPSRSRDTYLHPTQVSQEGQKPEFSPFYPPRDDLPAEAFIRPSPLGGPYGPRDTPSGSYS